MTSFKKNPLPTKERRFLWGYRFFTKRTLSIAAVVLLIGLLLMFPPW